MLVAGLLAQEPPGELGVVLDRVASSAEHYASRPMNVPELTFDDGPAPDTEALLDLLARHRVRATFFLVGERVAGREGALVRMVRDGHALGNDSWDHPDLRTLTVDRVREQLTRTSEAIEAASGVRPKLFRPPYGYTSVAIERTAESLGMRTILWDVDTRDYELPGEAIAVAIA